MSSSRAKPGAPLPLRAVAVGAGFLGGACWVAYMFVMVSALQWAGTVLLGVALVALGAGLARGSEPWLRALSGVGLAVLAGSVFTLFRDAAGATAAAGTPLLQGVVGGLATLLVAVSLLRSPAPGNL